MSDTMTQDLATAARETERRATEKYFVLRRPPDVKKVFLAGRPLGVAGSVISGGVDAEYKLNAAFDFNGDGFPDLFGHHQVNGDLRIWWGNALGGFVKADKPSGAVGPEWQLQVARFRRGGTMDVFGHNRGSVPYDVQKIRVWHLDRGGRHVGTSFEHGERIGLEWDLHLGDVDGDGIVDIVGVHRETRDLNVWFVKEGPGGTLVLDGPPSWIGQIEPEWQLQVADINDDGCADVFGYRADNLLGVWINRRRPDGRWKLNDGYVFGDLGNEWGSLQIAYLDGDGFPDLLGQSTDGSVRGWYSNGAGLDGGSELGSDLGWWTPLAGGTHLR